MAAERDRHPRRLATDHGSVATEISRGIVALYSRLYGRGATKVKTHLNDEYALTVLEEVFTPAEHTLIAAGKEELVIATRGAFQKAVKEDFVAVVEKAVERPVRAFISQVTIEEDIAVELFFFEQPASVT